MLHANCSTSGEIFPHVKRGGREEGILPNLTGISRRWSSAQCGVRKSGGLAWRRGAGIISSLTLRDGYRSGEMADGGDDNDNRIMPSCGGGGARGKGTFGFGAAEGRSEGPRGGLRDGECAVSRIRSS